MNYYKRLYSRTAVVPLHTQWLAAIGCLQQFELKQDGLVQVSTHKCLVVVDRDTDHWGVHYRVSRKPGGEKVQRYFTSTAADRKQSLMSWLGWWSVGPLSQRTKIGTY